jgi:hypothetical protein
MNSSATTSAVAHRPQQRMAAAVNAENQPAKRVLSLSFIAVTHKQQGRAGKKRMSANWRET